MKPYVPLFLALVACGASVDDQPASAAEPERAAVAAAEAPCDGATDYVPGSHEDWCAGHGVPESQCTRCNPDLIPAFQAVGDWCDEHGLPMSQCTVCDPDLVIERPPKEG
jgi:hypothetical protein